MRNASLDRTTRYSANAPSISEPSDGYFLAVDRHRVCIVETSTRSPSRDGSTADPATTMRPQQSHPGCGEKIRGFVPTMRCGLHPHRANTNRCVC